MSESIEIFDAEDDPRNAVTARFGPVRRMVIRVAALTGGGLALVALIGWWLEAPILRSLNGGRWQMNPVTALGHLTLATVLWRRVHGGRTGSPGALARWAGSVLALVGGYQVLALLTGWVPRLDRFLLADRVREAVSRGGAGVSVETGVSFVLLGVGLALVGRGRATLRSGAPWEAPVVLSCLFAFFSLVRYAYASYPWTPSVAAYFPMAPNTAAAFLAASVGILAAFPGGVVAARFGGGSVASGALRRLMAGSVLVLTVGGLLRVEMERRGLVTSSFGTSLLVTVGVIVVGVMLWRQTVRLEAAEVGLRSALADRTASEVFSRTLFELAPDALLLVDGAGRIVRANDEMESLSGYRPDALVGQSVEILVPEGFRAGHEALRQEFMARPERRSMGTGRELALRREDGVEIPAEIALAPVDLPAGRQVMVAFKDMTHRERMRRDLELRARLLEDTNRELEAFSFSVSHDLRAPLRAIRGFSRVLEEQYSQELPEEARRILGLVREGVSRMGRLIEDLLSFARLGRTALRLREVRLDELVRSSFEEVTEPTGGNGSDPDGARRVKLIVGDLPPCRVDPALLRQALTNLISNAVKFSRDEERPVVEVGCHRNNGMETVFFVRDNGVGFDPRYADRLFGVFQRLHAEEEFEGTGVGLALAQRILHRHDGRIWAESSPGEGATFYFTLGSEESPS